MEDNYKIQSGLFRYIVPFRLGISNDFDKVIEVVESQIAPGDSKESSYIWIRQQASSSESDIYEYVRNEFRYSTDSVSVCDDNRVGASWLYKNSDLLEDSNGKGIFKDLFYSYYNAATQTFGDNEWKVSINNLGLLLFKNGIGILWYEIVLPKNLEVSDLIKYQSEIKELNRGQILNLWSESTEEPIVGYIYKRVTNNKTGQTIVKYREPFSIGEWIEACLAPLKPKYFAERKSSLSTKLNCAIKTLSKDSEKEVIDNRENELVDDNYFVPDKSILFSYVSVAEKLSPDDMRELAYYISKGYGQSYKMCSTAEEEFREPFENVLWHSAKEGCVVLSNGDSEFMRSGLKSKVGSDYFDLFLRVIYQSYSLLHYAERIQSELAGDISIYLSNSTDCEISNLYGEINLFLAKSMATSVSYIHHQNEFYVYLNERFRIHEDVNSVVSGLEALDSLQREEREAEDDRIRREQEAREKKNDNKLQAIMGLFALLGIGSAFTDCFDFIARFNDSAHGIWDMDKGVVIAEIGAGVLILIISILAIFFTIKALIEAFKDEK